MKKQPQALALADLQSVDAYACSTLTAECLRRQHALIVELRESLKGMMEVFGGNSQSTRDVRDPIHGLIRVPENQSIIDLWDASRSALANAYRE